MPRKVNYGIDYDDGYDDYDYGYDVEENVKEPSLQDIIKHGVWRCSVCTYHNDDTMSSCDICGILRSPSVSNGTYDEKRTAPFKFDVPSPDDLVSNGLHSSEQHSKAKIFDFKSSRAPSSGVGKNEAVKVLSSAKRSDSSHDSTGKDKHDGIIFSKNLEINTSSGFKASDKSSASMAKGRVGDSDGRSVSINMCSSGQSSSSLMPKERTDMVEDGSSLMHGGEGHNLTSNLKNMTLAAKSGNSKDIKANSRAQYKPEKWMLPEKAEGSLTQLNLAIVGHVDSGKSTLSGRLLHLLGRISQKEMHKYEKESKLQGKGSFAYAWALDESAEERERGVTMTVAVTYLDSKRYHVVVLDSPGHKDFVPNMITGATQADAAILVIDASIGSFEAGMDGTKGQTREHAQLIRSFGVDQIIVAVNKMDAVEYSKVRFDLIKSQLGTFLRSCDFKDSSVTWIPLSAVENQNLVVAPSDVRLSWYHGPYLLDAIDSFQPSSRDFSKPLLMPICDVIKSSQGQVSACGKLEAGAVRSGSKVLVMPSADIATVRSLERDSQTCSIARAGDNVAINLHGIDGNHVIAGGMLCHPDFPVAFAKHLELKVLVLDGATPILMGSQASLPLHLLEFYAHHAKEAARVARISSLLDSKTGKVTKKAPRCIVAKQNAVIEEPVCIEMFSKCKALGRVFLRTLGRTVAVGVVTRIVEELV
ncbi:HBS1-like protein isoform X2 [Gossypium australe]|uniref:HBS1-like protein isoform X2 n=1 Tax=Gossypium australe TaxID=47621 RepID=A0A5B6X7H5_9ROSI|nr:HBS1-like protein isoform X2 [Gossypium australe]